MSVLRHIKLFILAFLEMFKEKDNVKPTIVVDEKFCMKENVKWQLVSEYSFEEQAKIREYIRKQEEQGIYNYTFETSKFKVVIRSTSGHGAQFMNQKKEMEGTSY